MKFLKLENHIICLGKICYVHVWGYRTIDVYFSGRKKPLGLTDDEADKLLEALGSEAPPLAPEPEILLGGKGVKDDTEPSG